jgi:hypothetical protein
VYVGLEGGFFRIFEVRARVSQRPNLVGRSVAITGVSVGLRWSATAPCNRRTDQKDERAHGAIVATNDAPRRAIDGGRSLLA